MTLACYGALEIVGVIIITFCTPTQNYTVSQKKLCHFFTAYNFRNIEQIFTKLGLNHVLFI